MGILFGDPFAPFEISRLLLTFNNNQKAKFEFQPFGRLNKKYKEKKKNNRFKNSSQKSVPISKKNQQNLKRKIYSPPTKERATAG